MVINFHLGRFTRQILGALEAMARGDEIPRYILDGLLREAGLPEPIRNATPQEIADMGKLVTALDAKADQVAAMRAAGQDPGDVAVDLQHQILGDTQLFRAYNAIKDVFTPPSSGGRHTIRILPPDADALIDGRPERASQRSALQRRTQRIYDALSAAEVAAMEAPQTSVYENAGVALSTGDNLGVRYDAASRAFELVAQGANGQQQTVMTGVNGNQVREALSVIPPAPQFLDHLAGIIAAGAPAQPNPAAGGGQGGAVPSGNGEFNYPPIDLTGDTPPPELPVDPGGDPGRGL